MSDLMRPLIAAFVFACLIGAALFWFATAHAEWRPEYANADPATREWYSRAELTEAAQRRFSFKRCCDHADVVRTQFRVNKTTRGDEWYYLAEGVWKLIPPDIIHLDKAAPDNQPTLFVFQGQETCFFPGGSGI